VWYVQLATMLHRLFGYESNGGVEKSDCGLGALKFSRHLQPKVLVTTILLAVALFDTSTGVFSRNMQMRLWGCIVREQLWLFRINSHAMVVGLICGSVSGIQSDFEFGSGLRMRGQGKQEWVLKVRLQHSWSISHSINWMAAEIV
jgi:hypothetical protein